METEEKKDDIETGFIKLGNEYINPMRIERFMDIDGDIYLSTVSGKERTLCENAVNECFTVDSIARKINEKAHYIIPLKKCDEDENAGNLLYRKWMGMDTFDGKPKSDQKSGGKEKEGAKKPLFKLFSKK